MFEALACRNEFDVAITFEERVMDQLVTGAQLQGRV